ncbi:MAG: homoserine dehydrogenase [Acidobacteria bacterium RIFCSPLOWO2_12_FULL_59_11]|nr:MAG: homoserine dehydrogenase [Acidobacteria bacterium RIFCSPLOWO2_12_FULL_59_11]
MRDVNVGMVGLGTVGGSTLRILDENAAEIEHRLGFRLRVRAASSLEIEARSETNGRLLTRTWQEVVEHPEVEIVAELVGGTTIAQEVIRGALERGKPVVTANKELLGLRGAELAQFAAEHKASLNMEASVAGGIPILQVLREGISGDRIEALYGILNGTSNFILTEMEKSGAPLTSILAEAQKRGYAEANPTADVEGYDARSKLAILAAFCFGVRVPAEAIFRQGITRLLPIDFAYAHRLGYTIRLIGAATPGPEGLGLYVRSALIPEKAILSKVQGSYNAVWIKGIYGEDTLYYGRGAGKPTGVAVVSDLMRAARDLRHGSTLRAPAFGFWKLQEVSRAGIESQLRPYFLRFLVRDRVGIIAQLAAVLAARSISIDAVLQEPCAEKENLPFVITVEPTTETALSAALEAMQGLDFLCEPPLALPMETGLSR